MICKQKSSFWGHGGTPSPLQGQGGPTLRPNSGEANAVKHNNGLGSRCVAVAWSHCHVAVFQMNLGQAPRNVMRIYERPCIERITMRKRMQLLVLAI